MIYIQKAQDEICEKFSGQKESPIVQAVMTCLDALWWPWQAEVVEQDNCPSRAQGTPKYLEMGKSKGKWTWIGRYKIKWGLGVSSGSPYNYMSGIF